MESELKRAVEEVARAAEGLKVDIVLVGALMGEVTPEIEADYPRFRRTNDADFGIHVGDWTTYNKLRDELLRRAFTPEPRIEHRLRRGHALVDLIPYGPQIAPGGKLTWPESEFEMTVTGFEEVCAAARKSAPSKEFPVRVITVPGFVLLKVIAYLERKSQGREKHKNDAKDIEYWLRNYAGGTGDERRFGLVKAIDPAHDEYETAGAVLLGKEVGALASTESAAYVNRFLRDSDDRYSPFMDILAAGVIDEAADTRRDEGLALLAAFRRGFGAA